MKYAVLSDIHGNYPALQAVTEDARRQGISHYLFAGDYCISGPWPDECIAAIQAIPEKTVIRGNEEKYLENLIGKDPSLWTDGQMQVSYWCYRNIRPDHLRFLLNLPHTADFECNGIKIHMAHSSVDFMGTYPFYTWNSVTVAEKNKQPDADPERILAELAGERDRDPVFQGAVSGLEEGIYIFGHSHIQWSCKAKDAEVYLINPGSCGLPLDGIRDSIPYTVLEITEDGQVQIEEKRIPFDKAAYIRAMIRTGQYREANVWSRVIMKELVTAREHMYYFLAFAEQYAKDTGDERRPFATETWEKAFEIWNRESGDRAIPSRTEAEELLREAESRNPGPWGNHSRTAAHCAEKIAEACEGMNPEKAYILGLLHDIGRRFGVRHLGHVSDGYSYMMSLGYEEAARICLTHSFNNLTTDEYIGRFDTTDEELELIRSELRKIKADDYDRLIQLCDALAGSEGVMSIEDRMNDVKRRYGSFPKPKWDSNLELKRYFEEKAHRDIYDLVEKDRFTLQ